MDLVLGNYEVEGTEGVAKPSPLRQERDWKFFAVSNSCGWVLGLKLANSQRLL